MFNKGMVSGLLLGGLICCLTAVPAMTQSALAQQSATQQSSKSSTANSSTSNASTAKSTSAKSTSARSTSTSTASAAKKSPPRPLVYIEDNRSVKAAEASTSKTSDTPGKSKKPSDTSASQKPQSTDLSKAFQQNCPSVALTDSKTKAAFVAMFEREPGGKGVKTAFGLTNAVHKTSKIEVMNKSGKELFSETGHSTSQLVKDACTAIGTPGTKLAKN